MNSPVTTAGCMASMNAGTLLGIVLSQLVREGAPVAVPGWNGGPYNLKTMVGNYVLADEQGVPTSMGKYYDLPVFGLGGSTDSKVIDQQCGFEITLSLMAALLHGANIIHDVGFMESGLQGSMQIMAISNDILGFFLYIRSMVQQDGESLNLARGDSKVHRRPLVGKRLHGNSFGQEQPHSVAVALRWSRGTNKFRPNDSLAQLHDQTY